MKERSVAWVFVSHSTRDLNSVRRIRNALEERGAEPILFFLKCIQESDELDQLLKREITARNFFLLCDSANARESKWVRDEVDFVKSLPQRRFETIDLASDWERQLASIDRLAREATAFLSYHASDRPLVLPFIERLHESDFSLFMDPQDIPFGANWGQVISDELDQASRSGWLVQFLSDRALSSTWVERERSYFSKRSDRIVPVEIEPLTVPLPADLANLQMLRAHTMPIDQATMELGRRLLT